MNELEGKQVWVAFTNICSVSLGTFDFIFSFFFYVPKFDFFGYYLDILLAILVLPLLAIILSIVSLVKKEKRKVFSIVGFILGVLLLLALIISLSGDIPRTIPKNTPSLVASDALEEAYNKQSMLVTTRKTTFTNSQFYELSRKTMVEASGVEIEHDRVCLSLGDYAGFDGLGRFSGGVDGADKNPEKINTELGTREAKISVICYRGEALKEAIKVIYTDFYDSVDQAFAECKCVNDPKLNEGTCCIVALRIARLTD